MRAAAAAGCCAAIAAIYLVAVRTATGQALEDAAMDGRPVHRYWTPNPAGARVGLAVTCVVLAWLAAVLALSLIHI